MERRKQINLYTYVKHCLDFQCIVCSYFMIVTICSYYYLLTFRGSRSERLLDHPEESLVLAGTLLYSFQSYSRSNILLILCAGMY